MLSQSPPPKKYYDIDAVNAHRRALYVDQMEKYNSGCKKALEKINVNKTEIINKDDSDENVFLP